MPRVREAAQRALKLDPELSEAHAALGAVASQFDWDWSVAESAYRESIRLNPSNANAHLYYAFMLLETDRRDEAISEVILAHQLDPVSGSTSFYVAQTYYWAGRVDSAIAQCKSLIASEPNAYLPRDVLASCYQDQGLYSQALKEAKSAVTQSGDSMGLGGIAITYARAGHRREALETLARYDEFMIRSGGYLSHMTSAAVYANLGEKDSAFRFLQAAYEDRDENLGFIRTWTVFRPLRSDPRFDELLRRLRLVD
jgi:tetratricopeptide (TPR) repeat protein